MSGPTTPFWNRGGGFGITGSPSAGWTFTKTAQASTAETPIVVFGTSDGSGSLIVENASATDAIFSPRLRGVGQTTGVALNLTAQGVTDTGTNGVMQMVSRISTSTVIATRPMFEWLNHSTSILSLLPLNSGANSALSWGAQAGGAPTFTTRSVGTRAAWQTGLSGSAVDFATGVGGTTILWHSVPVADSNYQHILYGGTTVIHRVRGDGLVTSTGGRVERVRIALTTPVTLVAGTDHNVVTKLTAPGAVAVNLPAGVAGQRYIIQDGTGDAAANNVTITPAAGTINGAATLVIAANYGRADLVYDGATWLSA